MIRSILVHVDGSAFGEQVIPLALGLARRAGARLELVLVHVPYVPVESISDYPESIDRDVLFRERDYLRALRERLEKSAGIPVHKPTRADWSRTPWKNRRPGRGLTWW